jgi:SAM-dependent methyltransferase
MSIEIKNFYSKLKFPGVYTMDDILFYDSVICNDYLKFYNESVFECNTVLDVGCGSGFIVNFLAHRHKNIQFTAIDFGDGIDFAESFSKENNITNITYHKVDLLNYTPLSKYDLVFCNGVLHHIPDQTNAISRLKAYANDKIMLGVYNSYGKLAKKIFPVKYVNSVLYSDQEECPFELAYTDRQLRDMFNEYNVDKVFPSLSGKLVNLKNVFNYQNGGLTLYLLSKTV